MTPSAADLAGRRVLVVGDVMLDRYWHGAVDRISPEAPVPVVRVAREEDRLGGAANVALNIQMLGARATLLTVVGQDDAATRLKSLLADLGIEARLGQDEALRTIVKLRVIGRSQQLLRIDFESEPGGKVLSQLLADFERELPLHDAVLFSDYGKGALSQVAQMIEMARDTGRPVLVDPKGSDYARYTGATVLTPNRSELAQVVGSWRNEDELRERAQALRERLQVSSLLVTRSEEGMSLYDELGSVDEPARTREVFDVTGAGDTVIAAMGALMAAGLSARAAMPHANRAGGIVVGKFGTAGVTYHELFG